MAGCLGVVLNVVWFVVAGWYIALSHLAIAVAEFVSIIGIPFALKDLELAKLALAPVGRTIRDKGLSQRKSADVASDIGAF